MALIIPFKRKEIEQTPVNKLEKNTDDCPEPELEYSGLSNKQSRKITIIPCNGQQPIPIDKFRFRKKNNESKNNSENQKLRDGLVVKIHNHRRSLEVQYKKNSSFLSCDEIHEELLDICSDYADFMLDSELSALGLLNKYDEFKKVIGLKLTQLSENSSIL